MTEIRVRGKPQPIQVRGREDLAPVATEDLRHGGGARGEERVGVACRPGPLGVLSDLRNADFA